MKLTGLNIDCLENILEYLEFDDLLNAATSNKRLNQAASFIFDRNYNENVMLVLRNYHFASRFILLKLNMRHISDFKSILHCVRCFGHVISSITITTSMGSSSLLFKRNQYALDYINEYCSGTLTAIRIHRTNFQLWQHLRKPFANVEAVRLDECHITDRHALNRLFPKMLKLEFTCVFGSDDKSFFVNTNHFPNLKTLHINDYNHPIRSVFCGVTMAPTLRLNPQLEDLHLHTYNPLLDSIHFRNALRTLQNLQKLSFRGGTLHTNPLDCGLHLESVKEFRINVYKGVNNTLRIPFLFAQLDKFELLCWHKLNDEFFGFIDKHPDIQELTVCAQDLSAVNISIIAETLPSLKTIRVGFYGTRILVERNLSGNEAI